MGQTGFAVVTDASQIEDIKSRSSSVIVMQKGQQSDLQRRYEFETLIAGEKGSGKSQPIDSKVLTPRGFVDIGSLKVGSQVCNPDGSVASVIQIHPQGTIPVFRLTFSDGATTRASGDHLWFYSRTTEKLKADRRYFPFEEEDRVSGRVGTTLQLKAMLASNAVRSEKTVPNSIHVPAPKPVSINCGGKRGHGREIDAYVLGVILGDGCVTRKDAVGISGIDVELLDEVDRRTQPEGLYRGRNGKDHGLRGPRAVLEKLDRLGVKGKYSYEKSVPDLYKVAPTDIRLNVLRGLMDTDGTVSSNGACSFCSTSLKLAQDVQWLVRSIGGVSSISEKIPTYTHKGKKLKGRKAYIVSMRTDRDSDLFLLSRKKARCRDSRGLPSMRTSRYILSIEPDGEEECVCISIDNPNRLYITDDFIVTHNSMASIVWLVRGNLDVPDEKKTQNDILYVNCPVYRGAVVRKNIDDLNEWIENAKRVYGTEGDLLGATYTKQPREFTWPSGARLICLHMGDADAYQRITGQSITRLFWDEITFEPDPNVYEKVYSSIRSTHKDLRAQILLACNPEGPGLVWVKERFVRFCDPKGRIYPPGEVMRIPVYDPISKSIQVVTRLFLHWRLEQNRELLDNDPLYAARLSSITNQSLRRAYLFGDFDAAGGKFFEFRRSRREEEPENACHVYDASKVVIQPWWPRILGVDWGYSHYCVAYKVALSPDGRVWVIDEMAHKETGSREVGASLARWCASDMMGLKTCGVPPVIPVFISPDAIEQRRDSFGTTAENIRDGIMDIFGAGSSEILDKDDTTDDFEMRRMVQTLSKMPLRRATNKRHFGWDTMRSLMVWDSVAEPDLRQYDQAYADKLAQRDAHEYFRYQAQFVKKQEALPKLQISSHVRYLPDALESATSSPTDLEDIATPKRGNKDIVQLQDDARDAARYALTATLLYKRKTTDVVDGVQSVLDQPPMNADPRYQSRDGQPKKTVVRGFSIGRGANRGVRIQ